MKLVWCPEMASKAYIDGVRALAGRGDDLAAGSAEVAELVAAMAGGWNARLVVEAPDVPPPASSSSSSPSRPPAATSLALAAAARRTGARYACVLPDESAAAAYYAGLTAGPREEEEEETGAAPSSSSSPPPPPSVVVGEADEAMARLEGVDLLVIDARRQDAAAVLRAAAPGARGMVVVRHGDNGRRRGAAMADGTRVVRSVYLPIGKGGVEVLHVGVGKGPSLQTRRGASGSGRAAGRWIRHVNHDTGEEHVFRRQ